MKMKIKSWQFIFLAIIIFTIVLAILRLRPKLEQSSTASSAPVCSSAIEEEAIKKLSGWNPNNTWSIKDCKVYYQSTVIEGADIETLEILPDPNYGYSLDKNHVYYVASPIAEADPATFKIHKDSPSYESDKNHVFKGTEIVEGADP